MRTLLEVFVFDELNDDVFLRLNLKHLQDETQERGGLDVSGKCTADVSKFHRLVHQQFG